MSNSPSPFELALKFSLPAEAGFVDDPKDPGGATNKGVTQATYNSWLTNHNQPLRTVRSITSPEAEAIYRELYWTKAHCDLFQVKIAIALFDFFINAGEHAILAFQQALGVTADGTIGPKTIAAADEAQQDLLLSRFLAARVDFYYAQPTMLRGKPYREHFIKGWLNRVKQLRAYLDGIQVGLDGSLVANAVPTDTSAGTEPSQDPA